MMNNQDAFGVTTLLFITTHIVLTSGMHYPEE